MLKPHKPTTPEPDDRELWMTVRQAILLILDAVERIKLQMTPTTAELRKRWKKQRLAA